MAEPESIDDVASPATEAPSPSGGGSIFDSIGSSLESMVDSVKSIGSGIKSAAHYAYYTAKAAAGLAAGFAMGGTNALILPAGIAVGTWLGNVKNNQKTTYKQMANEVAIGGILGGVLHYMFAGCSLLGNSIKAAYGKTIGLIAKAGLGLATMPSFLVAHEYLNRAFIADYEPKPVEVGKQMVGPMKYIIPPVMANFSLVPEYLGHAYQMPVAAGVSVAYGLLKGDKKEEKKEAPALPAPGLPQTT